MALWRCPHCGIPQPETARCWVCHRSSTSCGTCRHFRRSVAGELGFCGHDRGRAPLHGDELRGCWEAERPTDSPAATPAQPRTPVRAHRDFVPLDAAETAPLLDAAETAPPGPTLGARPQEGPTWALFPELDR